MTDRSRDRSYELAEVRTVLGRAESAMEAIVNLSYIGNYPTTYGVKVPYGENGTMMEWRYDGPPSGVDPDPDGQAMYDALECVVNELARWRKAGKRKRR